jgi:hypothetical protein
MRRRWWIGLPAGGLLVASLSYALANPQMIRARMVEFSSLQRVQHHLFLDAALPPAQKQEIEAMVAAAHLRVGTMLGSTVADPIVIVPTAERFRDFGSSAGGTAVSYVGPLGTRIVIGPNGLNVDVIAHEMMHGELSARAGYFRRSWLIPTWFDEGLAMYVDHREPFSEARYQEKTQGGRTAPPLESIDSHRKFAANAYIAYLTAKHEFAEWYKVAGQAGLLRLMDDVKFGRSFAAAYQDVRRIAAEGRH